MRQSLRNCLALSLGLLLASGAVLAKPSNKWRLEFSGAAESPREIVLRPRFAVLGEDQLGRRVDAHRGGRGRPCEDHRRDRGRGHDPSRDSPGP